MESRGAAGGKGQEGKRGGVDLHQSRLVVTFVRVDGTGNEMIAVNCPALELGLIIPNYPLRRPLSFL